MMLPGTYTAFIGNTLLAIGSLSDVAIAAKHAGKAKPLAPLLIFDDATGRVRDVDLRGTDRQIAARVADEMTPAAAAEETNDGPRGRGRPKLGVVGREVTLLPRHWEWLATQPGGASVALRKLVEDARRANAGKDERRRALSAAFAFMSTMAGDLPGFEEASRALFVEDARRMAKLVRAWPADVRAHAIALAFGSWANPSAASPASAADE
jgi:hypothetical protein